MPRIPFRIGIAGFCLLTLFLLPEVLAGEPGGWTITQSRGLGYDTSRGVVLDRGEPRPGLESISRKGGHEVAIFWEEGAHQATVTLDGLRVKDGRVIDDLARLAGLRIDRAGSYVALGKTKGHQGRVTLLHDGRAVRSWAAHRSVRILHFDRQGLLLAIVREGRLVTDILSLVRDADGRIGDDATQIAEFADGIIISGRVRRGVLFLEVLREIGRGSDIVVLDVADGGWKALLESEADEFFAALPRPDDGGLAVLSLSGSPAARHAFHAISASLSRQLGEPRAGASDALGTQSWGQSYRILALAELFAKTGHPLFAEIAVTAMRKTLAQRNRYRGLEGEVNPGAAWASRLYSLDRAEPLSLLVNQGMIASALILACERLGTACPEDLSAEIDTGTVALVAAYEARFDDAEGLYRIPYGIDFRFDGLLAPWNWQMAWSPVLERAGQIAERADWHRRVADIASRFVAAWEIDGRGALWRYWPDSFYRGWTAEEHRSLHIPKRRATPAKRYEDIGHAGISLFALQALEGDIDPGLAVAVETTLARVLAGGLAPPRYIDGAGRPSSNMIPSAGWHAFGAERLSLFYTRRVPGASSGDQHLTYALLYDPQAPFDLRVTQQSCDASGCRKTSERRYRSLEDFLGDNPLFTITPNVGELR